MYSIHEFNTWPFNMSVEHNGIEIINVGRHAFGTNDTLATVSKRDTNIAQYASISSMIDKANRSEQLQAECDELRHQLEQAQAELGVAQDALQYIMETDSDHFMKHTYKQIFEKARSVFELNGVKL